jgi:hypothetical protein
MHRFLLIGATLLLAPAAQAAILWQATLPGGGGGPVYFDDFISLPSVTASGSTWIGISGGTITSADWHIDGELTKLWWELISEDDEGNQEIYLNGNEYIYSNGCTVTPGAPSCSSAGLLSRLHNNTVRVDFTAPVSYNNCFPFDGQFDTDCAKIYNLGGAGFSIEANGPGDITLTIHDTAIPGAVPEPAGWALLIAGFGLTGAVLRRRRLRNA